MKPIIYLLALFSFLPSLLKAQKVRAPYMVDSIYFHLYTDSLKKGIYNYINVDGRLPNGNYVPLTANDLVYSSNAGTWVDNNLIIDSSYQKDSVVIKATLKNAPYTSKEVTVYLKKNIVLEPLKTEEELLKEWKEKEKKAKKDSLHE
jgi:hypothetical protein